MLSRSLTILSILTAICSYAQKKVELTINPASVEVGETFSITVESTVEGELDFENVPDHFVQGYNIRRGSSSKMDYATGNVKVVHYYSFTGVITKAGKYTIGPAYITNGSRTYPSNEVTITIGNKVPMSNGEVTAKQLQDPAFGVIQVNKKTIYEGEPLLVSSKIYSSYNPSHVGAYKSYIVPGTTIKHPIGNTTTFKKSIEKFRGSEFYSFSYDKNVIFPSLIGKFQIEPFTMNLHQGYQNFPLTSNGISITILPLPANPPSDFIGGVGDFRIERVIDGENLKQGDVLKMVVTISGIGNLQNISDPVLNLPRGFTIYGDPQIERTYSVGLHGMEGEIVYEYNIEIKRGGDISLPATTISFFNPSKEKYVQSSTSEELIAVEKDDSYVVVKEASNEEKTTELVIHKSKIKEEPEIVNLDSFYDSPAFWGGIGTPILAGFLFLFFARHKEKSEDKIVEKRQKAAKDSEFKETISLAKSLINSGTDNEFYSQIDNVLRKAFEIEINFKEDRLINKSDILDFIEKSNNPELSNSVNSLFRDCEQFKYGFSANSTSREETLNELKNIVGKLNLVKW